MLLKSKDFRDLNQPGSYEQPPRLDYYILYVSIRALVPKTSIDEHLQES